MSYDATVFFGTAADAPDLQVARAATRDILGVLFTGDESVRMLGIQMELGLRAPFLRDTAEQLFSAFAFQLDLRCSSSGMDLVHPVALHAAEGYSGMLKGQSMLCLNGVEFLGVLCDQGRVIVDRMARHQELYFPWQYKGT